MHPRFYHYHYKDGSHITCCNLENEKLIVLATGYAICSPKDHFCKKRGRNISEGRALKAYNTKTTSNPIKRRNTEATRMIHLVDQLFKSIYKMEVPVER